MHTSFDLCFHFKFVSWFNLLSTINSKNCLIIVCNSCLKAWSKHWPVLFYPCPFAGVSNIMQGIVATLRDGFGFIRCVSRVDKLFFHFSEVIDIVSGVCVCVCGGYSKCYGCVCVYLHVSVCVWRLCGVCACGDVNVCVWMWVLGCADVMLYHVHNVWWNKCMYM